MQIDRVFQLIIFGVLGCLLVACANNPPPALPTPTGVSRALLLPISAILNQPQRWSGQPINLVSPVYLQGEERILIPSLTNDPALGLTQPNQAIWLEQAPPDSVRSQLTDGIGVLKIRGRLSPPGAYGRDQRFPYQISAEKIEVLQPERTTLINLAQNPRALDGVLLSVAGTLLAQQDSALLTDKVSEGGVPTGQSQIKLIDTALDPALLDRLKRSGEVRWGAVEVLGWSQNGVLTPFRITLAETP